MAITKFRVPALGKWLHAVVLRVVEKDPDGSPRKLEILRDNEVADLRELTEKNGGEPPEFWVVYGPKELAESIKPKGQA